MLPLAVCLLAAPAPSILLRIDPGPGNPRNSEGDLIALSGGRLLLVYTRFTGGGEDHATADLVARESADGGATWSPDRLVIANDAGQNVMSVSLLRLADGRIALFYLRKHSNLDCRPVVRHSTDEGATWGPATPVVGDDETGYYVLNNARVIQLRGGRLVAPLARHYHAEQPHWTAHAAILLYLSDDGGATWRASRSIQTGVRPDRAQVMLQEPGVVELLDGRLMIYCRASGGSQRVAYSADGGEAFGPFQPSGLVSPVSPATIARVPSSGHLVCVWNNHDHIADALRGKRTPLSVAVSLDDGRSWEPDRTLFDDPAGWYCYTAIKFAGEDMLLAHCAGNRQRDTGLESLQLTRVPIAWFDPR